MKIEKGDVLLVLQGGMNQEVGGIVYDIEPSGRVFVDYDGVVKLYMTETRFAMPLKISENLMHRNYIQK